MKALNVGKSVDLSIANLLERENAEEQTPWAEEIRLKVKKYIATSFFGHLYVNALLVLSILSCLQYIYSTYLENSPRGEKILNIFSYLELCLASLFAFDWCLNLFIADHKSEFFFSFFALVDFTTVIPIWLTFFFFTRRVSYYEIVTFSDLLDYTLHAAYTLRILRALRIHRKLIHIEDEVHRSLSQMILSIVTMMLFEAALMQYLESHIQTLPFHTWLYYIVVTTSTVGYGDITPEGALGRFMAMFIIIFAITFVPQQTNILIEKMNRSSVWTRAVYTLRGNQKHVLICGDLKSTSLTEFFRELFHEDHENMNLNAVILQPEPPNPEMQALLRDPSFSIVAHYLQGTPLVGADLMRAKANQALAIFLMGNKFSSNPDEEDAKTILQQFSIKLFIQTTQFSDPLFCMQLIRPENRRHLAYEDSPDDDKQLVVCLNEMKMGVMAKACLFPGASTLIFNLLTSFADDEEDEDDSSDEEYDADEVHSDGASSEDEDEDGSWMNEYQKGCDWEIYTTQLAEKFVGLKFSQLSAHLYQRLGIVLFALRVRELKVKSPVQILLNPLNYPIPPLDKYHVEGFVIAKNKASSDLSGKDENSGESSRSSQLAMISNALAKTAEVGTAIRRQSLAVVVGAGAGGGGGPGGKRDGHLGQTNPIKSLASSSTTSGWQSILNQYEQESTAEENQNQQEKLQKEEDDKLKKNFFIRESPIELSKAIVETHVLNEYPNMTGHMIVIAKSINNLYDYIKPLRAKYLGKLKYIILLHPFDISEHIWRRLSIFEGLLIVRGSPLEELDIIRAGIFRASQVVVLADPTVQLSSDENGNSHHSNGNGNGSGHSNGNGNGNGNGYSNGKSEALVDADAIFTYHCVKRLNEKAQILIEIVNHHSVSYLNTSLNTGTHETDYKFTPHFASGTLMTSSVLDSIVCQAFYNPQIIRVLDKLIAGTDCIDSKDNPSRNLLTSRRQGGAGGAGARGGARGGIQGSALYQISIPENLPARTYGKLFEHLSKDNIIPLGILRGVFPNMSAGAKGNKMPYVYTNPHKDTELFTCDKVFVLSPRILTNSKVALKDILAHFQLQSNSNVVSGSKKRSHSEEMTSLESLKTETADVTETQKKIESTVMQQTTHLTQRVDQILERITKLKSQMAK